MVFNSLAETQEYRLWQQLCILFATCLKNIVRPESSSQTSQLKQRLLRLSKDFPPRGCMPPPLKEVVGDQEKLTI